MERHINGDGEIMIEVPQEYLWALEVKEEAGPGSDVPRSDYKRARKVLREYGPVVPKDY